jgi:membrane-bound lytic murein transglycosylase B
MINNLRHILVIACCTNLFSCTQTPASAPAENLHNGAPVAATQPQQTTATVPVNSTINEADFSACINHFSNMAQTRSKTSR